MRLLRFVTCIFCTVRRRIFYKCNALLRLTVRAPGGAIKKKRKEKILSLFFGAVTGGFLCAKKETRENMLS